MSEFEPKHRSDQKYCSVKCRDDSRYKRNIKYYKKYWLSNRFQWKKEEICPICKKTFVKQTVHQVLCSNSCRQKKWKLNHREEVLKARRIYNSKRKLDPEKHKIDLVCRKKYRQNNPDKIYGWKRDRRAREVGAGGKHTKYEWEQLKNQYDYTCLGCGKKEPEIILTEDHIKPLTKGGSNDISNIQPLCHRCNSLKNNKENFIFSKGDAGSYTD